MALRPGTGGLLVLVVSGPVGPCVRGGVGVGEGVGVGDGDSKLGGGRLGAGNGGPTGAGGWFSNSLTAMNSADRGDGEHQREGGDVGPPARRRKRRGPGQRPHPPAPGSRPLEPVRSERRATGRADRRQMLQRDRPEQCARELGPVVPAVGADSDPRSDLRRFHRHTKGRILAGQLGLPDGVVEARPRVAIRFGACRQQGNSHRLVAQQAGVHDTAVRHFETAGERDVSEPRSGRYAPAASAAPTCRSPSCSSAPPGGRPSVAV